MRYLIFAAGVVTGLVLAYHHDKRPYRAPATLPSNVVRMDRATQTRRRVHGN